MNKILFIFVVSFSLQGMSLDEMRQMLQLKEKRFHMAALLGNEQSVEIEQGIKNAFKVPMFIDKTSANQGIHFPLLKHIAVNAHVAVGHVEDYVSYDDKSVYLNHEKHIEFFHSFFLLKWRDKQGMQKGEACVFGECEPIKYLALAQDMKLFLLSNDKIIEYTHVEQNNWSRNTRKFDILTQIEKVKTMRYFDQESMLGVLEENGNVVLIDMISDQSFFVSANRIPQEIMPQRSKRFTVKRVGSSLLAGVVSRFSAGDKISLPLVQSNKDKTKRSTIGLTEESSRTEPPVSSVPASSKSGLTKITPVKSADQIPFAAVQQPKKIKSSNRATIDQAQQAPAVEPLKPSIVEQTASNIAIIAAKADLFAATKPPIKKGKSVTQLPIKYSKKQ